MLSSLNTEMQTITQENIFHKYKNITWDNWESYKEYTINLHLLFLLRHTWEEKLVLNH